MAEHITFQNETTLQTPRLCLKGLTVSDAEALFRYRSLPEVTRFQGWAPLSAADAIRFVEEDICHEINQPDTWFQLGIFLKGAQTLIGDLGIHFLTDDSQDADDSQNSAGLPINGRTNEVEIGITIAPPFQGKGYATEALQQVMDFLFEELQKSKVIASVDPKNHKSMALMRTIGFQLEGINKNAVLFRGEWTDDAVFQMTKQYWQKNNNT